jgi:hypothetical protein
VVVPFLLVSLTIFLAVFAVAVNKSWLWSVREEIKTAADAAALAASAALADDDMLRGDVNRYPSLMERVANNAITVAQANPVRAHPFELLDNPLNAGDGDIVLGAVTMPLLRDFVAVPNRTGPHIDQGRMNAIKITGRQTKVRGNAPSMIFGGLFGVTSSNVIASSMVTLDHGVRGFDTRYGPIPLAPIALLSDSVAPQSWESLVEGGTGPDTVTFDRMSNSFMNGPDQIREFQASYPTEMDQLPNANVTLLYLPTTSPSDVAPQLVNGMSAADLASEQGRFVLPDAGTKSVAGRQVGPPSTDLLIQDIAAALNQLRTSSAARIWPLYRGFNAGANTVQVSGFVAARVVSVTPPADDQPLTFTLQATVLVIPTAVTDTDLHGAAATRNDNRYLGRLRRIE